MKSANLGSEPSGTSIEPIDHRKAGTIQSVSTAALFLRVLAAGSEPRALGEIAKNAGTSRPMAHRYLQSLVREGLAVQDPGSGFYDLGPLALGIGVAALRRCDPIEVAATEMKRLVSHSSVSGGIAIWTDRGPTLVRWYRSSIFSINSLGLGDVLPVDNTACGLLFQAFLPASKIAVARKAQPANFRGSQPSVQTLEIYREQQWVELRQHLLPHVAGQAVPVFDAQGEICCVMTTVANLEDDLTDEIGAELRALAIEVNRSAAGIV